MPARREIIPGRVYETKRRTGRARFRRVIGVHQGMVVYNFGGDRNYFCCLDVFKRATKPEPVASCNSPGIELLSQDKQNA